MRCSFIRESEDIKIFLLRMKIFKYCYLYKDSSVVFPPECQQTALVTQPILLSENIPNI